MADNFSFPIPKELLEPFIKEAVATSIVGALGDGTQLITQAVQEVLRKKVDKDGDVSKYSSENKYSLIDILAQKEIKKIVLEVLKEYAHTLRPQIEEGIRSALNSGAQNLGAALYERYMEDVYRELRIGCPKPHRSACNDEDD